MKKNIGILGCGYSVPVHIRFNDDPLFQQIAQEVNSQGIAEKDLFTGIKERRYLLPDEHVETLMVEAARQALENAQIQPEQIDRLYGYASVSSYITPNALYKVHQELQLSPHVLVTPINNEFSTFLLGLIHAYEAIEAGQCRYALVVCGTNWSNYMDYTQGHALGVGDGAGAAVVGISDQFVLVDYVTQTRSAQYGAMTMRTRPVLLDGRWQFPVNAHNTPIPTYEILLEDGIQSFQEALPGPAAMAQQLLEKHSLTGEDVALISHQATRVMLDYWQKALRPREYLETLEQFGNMTIATYPVNLAYYSTRVTAPYLLLVAVGVGYHQTALLLKRETRKSTRRERWQFVPRHRTT
ncbi:3-oxoacyl-ACP synthase III family protein [Dictyobacter arantiisoli]|uniref:3-oxoacyl-[acyl-carrier-protein] synthase 3 n=1 Tax=Dictyobacter arantiisoli TaxID=2014874 RepID=A0A5A5TGK8_9CHLR|nr:3-oxoacyl-[acyl-carrier-protein] synthase III C-terminal domain-containing protein [Dictyobacter arantiisoli]GCF10462.1 3-oxoacyl-[acyl-carrier-protein] synthase 3 [Dictyobacter arantiisoli]